MDKFEKYLQDNTEHLNLDKLDQSSWVYVENQLLKKRHFRIGVYYKVAMVAIVLIASIIAVNSQLEQRKLSSFSLAEYSEEMGEIESGFRNQIEREMAATQAVFIPVDYKNEFDLLINEIEILDKKYIEYVELIKTSGGGDYEYMLWQILNYYKLKLDVLTKIQAEASNINNSLKKQNYETKYEKINL